MLVDMASSSAAPQAKDADLYKKVPQRMEATNSRELGMQVSSLDLCHGHQVIAELTNKLYDFLLPTASTSLPRAVH